MNSHQEFDENGFRKRLSKMSNWGRWGPDDQVGAVNLVTPSKVVEAVKLVRMGKSISLSRPFPTAVSANNMNPAEHFMQRRSRGDGTAGSVVDYIAIDFHGQASTHLDALCHVWNRDGMWNGRDPNDAVTFQGVTWAGIENWVDGIVGRGVLLDVAANRQKGYVDLDEPVTAEELRRIAEKGDIDLRPGDVHVIHSGRDNWERSYGRPWGARGDDRRPGLEVSCLEFFYESECSLIVWDMMDEKPNVYGVPHTIHAILYSQGVGLLDNAYLEALASLCDEHDRSDFLVCIAPLNIVGGTGSPVNPLVIL